MKLNADGSATLNGITLTPEQVREIKNAEPQPKPPTITFAYTTDFKRPFRSQLSNYQGVIFINSQLYAVTADPNNTLSLGWPINDNANFRPWRLEVQE